MLDQIRIYTWLYFEYCIGSGMILYVIENMKYIVQKLLLLVFNKI